MATFEYKARTKEGEIRSGIIETSSEDAALDTLQQNGLIVLSLVSREKKSFLEFRLPFENRVSQKDIVIFSRQLSTLFEAHVPVVETLRILVGTTSRPGLRKAIAEILDDIVGGSSLSQAMGKYHAIFSGFYINLIRSGEESGKLQETFTYLADYLERTYYLANKARNAMIYPSFVLFAFIGVIVVMLVVVIPRLVVIFEDTGQAIPFYTQAIIFVSLFLRTWGLLVLLSLVGGTLSLWRWSLTQGGRLFFHRLQITAPVIGTLYQKLYMSRLTDNLQTLIAGGIPILRALSITGSVVGNLVYQRAIAEAIESVKGGGTISSVFEKVPEIPVMVSQMIKIGETSGKLDFILANIAKFYRHEVDAAVENLVALIEPALIIFLGVGVGVLVVAIMVPLYNLVGSV